MLKLSRHERWLRKLYKRVLTICNSERAIREGEFFDLMYVNLRHQGFNPHRQFAFIRYCDTSAFLIIANFDDKESDVYVNIPRLAVDMAGLIECNQTADDLLWGKEHTFSVFADKDSILRVGGHDALVVPLKSKR